MKLNHVSTFSGEGQIEIKHVLLKCPGVDFRKKVWERFPVVNREVEKELWPSAI
jgi:hypothetical protein